MISAAETTLGGGDLQQVHQLDPERLDVGALSDDEADTERRLQPAAHEYPAWQRTRCGVYPLGRL